jgi:hypothetical protein
MDLKYSTEEVAFRDELRTFFKEAQPEDMRQRAIHGQQATRKTWSPGSAS